MLVIVLGLGNIGAAYEATRHNLGFEVVERVAKALKAKPLPEQAHYLWASTEDQPQAVMLAQPTRLMNRSGWAAEAILTETGAEPNEMLVVVDDFNLPLGTLRFRRDGSDGGHNGLESIIECLETQDFPRLRLGIGPVPDDVDQAEFVLGRFEEDELKEVDKMLATAAEAVLFAIGHRLELAMSKYNISPAQP